MKKTIFSILLIITLLFASIPVALAESAEKILASDYDYSFIVTVNSPTQRTFSLSDFGELPEAEGLSVFRKTETQEGYTYEMVIVDRSQLAVNSMEAVKNNPLVSEVSRNIHAKDYNEKASTVSLSETVIKIPVGGTATVNVVDTDFKEGANRYRSLAIQIDLDPQVMSFEDLQLMATQLSGNPGEAAFKIFAMYEEDADYIEEVHEPWLVYKQSYDGFGEKSYDSRMDTPSPIHRYMIANMLESKVSNEEFIQHFIEKDGVEAACLTYLPLIGAMAPFETWEVSNEKIASIDVTGGDKYGLNATVTITGKQVGSTILSVTRSEGSTPVAAGCIVTVYDGDDVSINQSGGAVTPTDATPTDIAYGDVNEDEKVDAKDALEVLRYSVSKQGQFSGAPVWEYTSAPPATSTDITSYSMPEKSFESIESFRNWVENLPCPPENYAYESRTFWTYMQPCYQQMFYYNRFYLVPNVDESLTMEICNLFPSYLLFSFVDQTGNQYWYSVALTPVQVQPEGGKTEYNGRTFYVDYERNVVQYLVEDYLVTTTLVKNEKGQVDLKTVQNAFIKISLPPMNDPVSLRMGDVNGDGKINARDALEILKYTVKKINKFPIEEITVTPTDVTPTNR